MIKTKKTRRNNINTIECSFCKKTLYQGNTVYSDKSLVLSKGELFKNITVFFLSQNGEILIKCKGCGKVTKIPFSMFKKDNTNLMQL